MFENFSDLINNRKNSTSTGTGTTGGIIKPGSGSYTTRYNSPLAAPGKVPEKGLGLNIPKQQQTGQTNNIFQYSSSNRPETRANAMNDIVGFMNGGNPPTQNTFKGLGLNGGRGLVTQEQIRDAWQPKQTYTQPVVDTQRVDSATRDTQEWENRGTGVYDNATGRELTREELEQNKKNYYTNHDQWMRDHGFSSGSNKEEEDEFDKDAFLKNNKEYWQK